MLKMFLTCYKYTDFFWSFAAVWYSSSCINCVIITPIPGKHLIQIFVKLKQTLPYFKKIVCKMFAEYRHFIVDSDKKNTQYYWYHRICCLYLVMHTCTQIHTHTKHWLRQLFIYYYNYFQLENFLHRCTNIDYHILSTLDDIYSKVCCMCWQVKIRTIMKRV